MFIAGLMLSFAVHAGARHSTAFVAETREGATYSMHCGRERWAAKVLADGTSLYPGLQDTSVSAIRALPRPFGVDGMDAPRVPSERHVVRVRAELLGYKLESDGDIHLVLAQPGDRTQTIIAEIPNASPGPNNCMKGASSNAIAAVAQARLAFVRAFGIPPVTHFSIAYRRVTITGPLFFDFAHDQDGVSPTAVEIHPAFEFSVDGGAGAAPQPVQGATFAQPANSSQTGACERVWVNTRSGVYHLAGSRWYGHTHQGTYMCKADADRQGYHEALREY